MKHLRYLTVALLSMTLIGLELTWTRIFSAEFFYTFAFLVLSLAVLGLGLGALFLRLFPKLDSENNLPHLLSLTAFFTIMGPAVVFMLNLDFSSLFNSWTMVGKLLVTVILLNAAYFWGGMALASIFRRHNQEMPSLYMADLLGAAAGVLITILLMNLIQTPPTAFLVAVPVLVLAFILSPNWRKVIPLVLTILMVFLSFRAESLLQAERKEPADVIHTHWDAVAKVKVYEESETYQMLNIDNIAHTGAYKFDGNWDRPDSSKLEFSINLSTLISRFDSCRYAVIGAGGGGDVLQPLQANVARVYAVEVIPYINEMLSNGMLTDFTGAIYRDPRVEVVTEDGRVFIRRYKNTFDIIYSSSSNTFAALASGAFALAENYLFTTEAFYDYWQALSDSGFMVLEHQVYVPRIVSEVQEALSRSGVQDPTEHFAVYNWPRARRNILLLSKQKLTSELINGAITGGKGLEDSPFYPMYPPADSVKSNLVNRIVEEGWLAMADSAKTDISPCYDNRPYIAQMGLWKNLDANKLEKVIPYSDIFGFPLSKMIIVIILLIVIGLIIPLNLLPYLLKGEKLKVVPWLYFFTIGMAFMIVEIILIQKYALFIGPSVYSISTVLLTLLLGSGLGSRLSQKLPGSLVFVMITFWLLLDIFIFNNIAGGLTRLSLIPRMLMTAAFIFPLGFFMGMPFPKGALRVGSLVDWGFAVNGAAAVLGSASIMLIAFAWGFQVAMMVAVALYLVAWFLFTRKQAWN